MKEQGILSDIIRARITSIEYRGVKREDIEKLYIQEYGKPPPNFDIIQSKDFNIGKESGFNGTAIHFHNEDVNEVYFFNRGTEANIEKLKDGILNKFKAYKREPEKIKEILFDGNEDIYTDIYTVLLGEDQFSTQDNIVFTNKVIEKVERKNSDIELKYYLDVHSLGGAEGQSLMVLSENLFTNVNVYNDAPMNILNITLISDKMKKIIEEEYNIPVRDIHDLHNIPTDEVIKIFDQEYGHYSNKITYHRNEDDILTRLTLPIQHRLFDENNANVKTYAGNSEVEMIDLVEKYPNLATGITFVFRRANKEGGVRARDIAVLAGILSINEESLWSFINQFNSFLDDVSHMGEFMGDGHSMDKVIENMAEIQGRLIINNQEVYLIPDSTGNKKIELNIDATYAYYKIGHSIMIGKKNVLERMKQNYEWFVLDKYARFKRKAHLKMEEIESYPHAHLSSEDRYTYDTQNMMIYKNLRFIEDLPPNIPLNLSDQLIETIIQLEDETIRQEKLLETYKDGIIKLVEADERVAMLFNTYLERREKW